MVVSSAIPSTNLVKLPTTDFWPGIIFALPVIRPESGADPVAETVSAIAYQQRDFFVTSLLGFDGLVPGP